MGVLTFEAAQHPISLLGAHRFGGRTGNGGNLRKAWGYRDG